MVKNSFFFLRAHGKKILHFLFIDLNYYCGKKNRRLVLYVIGNKNDGGAGHISLYVRMEETDSLPYGWEVNVDLKLFVHNPKTHKYLTVTGIFSSFISQNLYNVLWTLIDPFH